MADPSIGRMRVALSWDKGGPGVNTFYFTTGIGGTTGDWGNAADQFYQELAATYQNMSGALIPSLRWEVENSVDILDVATGNITDQFVPHSTILHGIGQAPTEIMSRATQGWINFMTDVWQNGKRLRGGIFFGPIAPITMTADGEISLGSRENWEASFDALTSGVGPRLAVYHRPGGNQGGPGYYGDVTGVKAKLLPAVLKSRRD